MLLLLHHSCLHRVNASHKPFMVLLVFRWWSKWSISREDALRNCGDFSSSSLKSTASNALCNWKRPFGFWLLTYEYRSIFDYSDDWQSLCVYCIVYMLHVLLFAVVCVCVCAIVVIIYKYVYLSSLHLGCRYYNTPNTLARLSFAHSFFSSNNSQLRVFFSSLVAVIFMPVCL